MQRPAMPLSGSVDSLVIRPALAKWWNRRQRSSISGSSSGESAGSGSFSKTSSAAPAIQRSFSAFASAFSSTTGPREALIRYASLRMSFTQRFFHAHVFDPVLFLHHAEFCAQVHHLLRVGSKLVVLVNRIVAKHVHVKASAFLDQRQPNASGADHGNGLAGNLVAQEGKKWMPCAPLLVAHHLLAVPHAA